MALLRPCSTAAGFTATPEQKRRVAMDRLRAACTASGYEVLIDARVVLIVRGGPGATESSIYEDGKVLLKTADRDEAEAAYAHLRPMLEAAWGAQD